MKINHRNSISVAQLIAVKEQKLDVDKLREQIKKMREQLELMNGSFPPEPVEPREPVTYEEYASNFGMNPVDVSESAYNYPEKMREYYAEMETYDHAKKVYLENPVIMRATSLVMDLAEAEKSLSLSILKLGSKNIQLEPSDINEMGALTDKARITLEQMGLPNAEIDKLDAASKAQKELAKLCSDYLKKPDLLLDERRHVETLQKTLTKGVESVVVRVDVFRKALQEPTTFSQTAGERFKQFAESCVAVIRKFLSLQVTKKETPQERMSAFKEKVEQVRPSADSGKASAHDEKETPRPGP